MKIFLKMSKSLILFILGVFFIILERCGALENCSLKVKKKGKLVLAIYNDQGGASRRFL